MKVRCALAFLAAVSFFLPPLVRSQSKQQTSASSQQILFAVWPPNKQQPEAPLIDPIVILKKGTFQKLPEYNYDKQAESDAVFKRFENHYFKRNTQYPLLIGGHQGGTVTVGKAGNVSCVSQVASVTLSPLSPPHEMALSATSVHGFGLHDNWRKQATNEQRAAFLQVASDHLKAKAITGVPATAIKIEHLYSTSLGAGRPDTLVGDFSVKRPKVVYKVFLVATQKDDKYVPILATDHVVKDLTDWTDGVTEIFVDQLDMDNDGIDEIITRSRYYESWDYSIYKEQQGRWKRVFQGGGGGC